MSKPRPGLDRAVRITFMVLLGALVLFLGLFFLIVFVPVAAWYLWQLSDRNRDLEARLAAIESPPEKKQKQE